MYMVFVASLFQSGMCGSNKYPVPKLPPWKVIETPMGIMVFKVKLCKGKCEAKLEFPEVGGRGRGASKPKIFCGGVD